MAEKGSFCVLKTDESFLGLKLSVDFISTFGIDLKHLLADGCTTRLGEDWES
jgi:hypothetical protein